MTRRHATVWVVGLSLWVGCPASPAMDGGSGGGSVMAGGAAGGLGGGSAGGGTAADAGAHDDGGVDAGVPLIEVMEQLIDFGTIDCGSTPAERTVSVRNVGTGPLAWRASLEGAQPAWFALSGAAGTIAPGMTAQVRVRFVQRPGSIATPQALMRIDSADLSRTPTVALRAQTRGPFFNTLAGLDFGSWPLGTAITTSVPLFNTGTVPATVTVAGLQGEFATADGGSSVAVTLPAGTTTPVLLPLTFRAQRAGPVELTAQVSSSVSSCGEPFGPLTLRGEGTSGAVTGLADLDFGVTDCGAQAGPLPVRVTNSGGAAFQLLTATLGKGAGSPYAVSGFTAGMSVMPGATVEITVTPRAVPAQVALPGDFSDVLELTTSVPGDTAHLVRLSQQVRGAVFVWDSMPATLESSVGRSVSDVVTVRNLGNADVELDATVAAPFEVRTATSSAGSKSWGLDFLPMQAGTFAGTITLSNARGALCAPLPPPLPVTGRSSPVGLRVLDQRIVLQHRCGQAPHHVAALRLSNDDAQVLRVTPRWTTSPGPFELHEGASVVSASPQALQPGALWWLSVMLRAPISGPVEDLLSVTTDRPGDEPRLVAVSAVPLGTALRLSSPGVLLAGTPGSLVVSNDGTLEATVSLTATPSTFSVPPTVTVPAGQQRAVQVRYLGAGADVLGTITATANDSCVTAAPVSVTGRALSSALVLSRNSLDFGLVTCGAGPSPTQTVTLTNAGTGSANWAVNGPPVGFEIRPSNGTLAPNQSVELSVTHRGFLASASVFGQSEVTGIGTPGTEQPLTLTAQSGRALLEPVGAATAPRASVPGTAAGRLRYSNQGTVAGTLRFVSDRGDLGGGTMTVLPGETRSLPVLFAPADAGVGVGSWTVTAERHCAAPVPPSAMALEATPAPQLSTSHPAFDLGVVQCPTFNSTSATMLIRNPTSTPVSFTAALVADAGMWALSPLAGSIPARGTAQLDVTLQSLSGVPTARPVGEPMVVVTSSLGALHLPVDVAARGADVRTSVAAGTGDTRVVGVSNHGNLRGSFTVTVTPSSGASVTATVAPGIITLEPLSSTALTVTRTSGTGGLELRFTPVAGQAAVCSAAPAVLVF